MTNLTPQQAALIPEYRDKWTSIALSTEPINRQKVTEAVKSAYDLVGRNEPEILFFDSPYAAITSEIWNQAKRQSGNNHIVIELEHYLLRDESQKRVLSELYKNELFNPLSFLGDKPLNELSVDVVTLLLKLLDKELASKELGLMLPLQYYTYPSCCLFDFCISVLNYTLDWRIWEILQLTVKYSGFIFTFEKIAFACNRPIKVLLDSENCFHAEGEPAILFADGFGVYAHHGVWLSEK